MEMELSGTGDEGAQLEDNEPVKTEPDLPPEYCRYRDEGCEFADACLNCPFPQCLYDEPRGRQRWLKQLRNREIARLYGSGGWRVKEVASLFGLSQRTVQRALKGNKTASKGDGREGGGKLHKGEGDRDE
jgi:hypothetical protein